MSPRKSDLIGVLGLVMILVWTPAYHAQDETGKGLTGGRTFTVPYPHLGDTIEYAFVIRDGDAAPVTSRPALRVSFDASDRTDPDATSRYRVEWMAINVTSPRFTYASHATEAIWDLDPEGRVLWEERNHHHRWGDTETDVWTLRQAPIGCLGPAWLLDVSGTTHRYSADKTEIARLSLMSGFLDERPRSRCGDDSYGHVHLHDRAFRYGDHVLYGSHILRADRWYNHFQASSTDTPIRTCTVGSPYAPTSMSGTYKQQETYRDSFGILQKMRLGAFSYACDIRQAVEHWHWIDPELPIPAGLHFGYRDAEGENLLTIDLLPVSVERGAVPLYTEPAPALEKPVVGPTTTLTALKTDETPLFHGFSIQEIHAIAQDSATGSERTTLAQADLMHFHVAAWTDTRNVTTGDALPIIGEQTVHLQTTERSIWSLRYRGSDGRFQEWQLNIDRDADGLRAETQNVCTGPSRSEYCGEKSRIAEDLRLVAPAALLAGFDDHRGPMRADFLDPPAGRASTWTYGVHQPPKEGGGLKPSAAWSDTPRNDSSHIGSSGTWSLDDGTLTREIRTPIQVATLVPDPMRSTETTGLVFVDTLGTGLAYGGILLILVSLLARFAGAIKSGSTSLAIATLYAKIKREHILEHERRDAVHAAIREDPGITLIALKDRLGYGWGSTVHHVETLIRHGLLVDLAVNRRRHLFVTDVPLADRRRIAARSEPELERLLVTIESDPGQAQHALADRLGRPESAISRHSARLVRLGLVEKRRTGRTVHLYPRTD